LHLERVKLGAIEREMRELKNQLSAAEEEEEEEGIKSLELLREMSEFEKTNSQLSTLNSHQKKKTSKAIVSFGQIHIIQTQLTLLSEYPKKPMSGEEFCDDDVDDG
jgi:predicted transcriptional regulator